MNAKETFSEADQTFTEMLDRLSAIEASKNNTVPFEGSWTAGQLAQHVILSAGGFVEMLNGPVKDTDRDPEQNVQGLRDLFLNFDTKLKSPEFIVPEAKEYHKDEAVNTLEGIKAGLLQAIETLDPVKTCTLFEVPGAGYLTRAEAMTFAIVHTKRHVHQLKHIQEQLA